MDQWNNFPIIHGFLISQQIQILLISAKRFTLIDQNGNEVQESGLLLYNGGAVCAEGFYTNEAVAVCRKLGYNVNGAKRSSIGGAYRWDIQDTLRVTMHDVDCTDSMEWSTCEFRGKMGKSKCRNTHVYLTCDG